MGCDILSDPLSPQSLGDHKEPEEALGGLSARILHGIPGRGWAACLLMMLVAIQTLPVGKVTLWGERYHDRNDRSVG
jgi:hypothetical protein